MARLTMAQAFWSDYSGFESRIQKSVDKLVGLVHQMSLIELSKHKGVHLEPYNNSRDKRARTMRVDNNHRLIAMDMGDGESLLFVAIDTHDKVDDWMQRNEFRINEATNAIEIVDVKHVAELENASNTTPSRLFAHRRARDFVQLGVSEEVVPAIMAMPSEDELHGILSLLPPAQADAVIELTDTEAEVQDIWTRLVGTTAKEAVDTEDFVAAVEKPINRSRFRVVTSDEELAKMLAEPAAIWRTYLHHSQEALAYRPSYSGPARVSGGAGTGKTIVAIHRANALAQKWIESGEVPKSKPILFTTFTRNLAQSIERDIRSLGGSTLLDLVEVVNVDQLARRIVNDGDANAPTALGRSQALDVWERIVDDEGISQTREFLHAEWEHVVLAQNISSRADYFQARRSGRGVPLDRRSRAEVWKAIELFTQHLMQSNARTFLQLAESAAGYLDRRTDKPYEHIIVDEAQDLHETQWHLLRAAVAPQPNDIFIVGDTHQRIYDRRTSLKREGIDIVGRSSKLRINYRTSAQILSWAMALLGEETYDDMDDGVDGQNLAGFHSLLSGERPVTCAATSAKEQSDALIAQIRVWLTDDAIELTDIGIAARSQGSLNAAGVALEAAGLTHTKLGPDLRSADGIRLGTMHRMKGLEFKCVAIIDCDDGRMPMRAALTDKTQDELQHRLDLQQERCLLYVACTRARNHLWVGWSGKQSRFLGPILGD